MSDWKVPVDESIDKSKMVLVIRKDLKVPKGKYISQGAHAATCALIQALFGHRITEDDFDGHEIKTHSITNDAVKDWLTGEFTKITVGVNSLEDLEDIEAKAREQGLNVCKIVDNGHTCFEGIPTVTCIAIGPDYSSNIDLITKNLPLF